MNAIVMTFEEVSALLQIMSEGEECILTDVEATDRILGADGKAAYYRATRKIIVDSGWAQSYRERKATGQ